MAAGTGSSPLFALAADPRTATVEIKMFAFVPAAIEVRVGDTVAWTNTDLVPHTATAIDKAWDTGSLKTGAAGRFVAKTTGTFAYRCAFHPQMTGTVAVVA